MRKISIILLLLVLGVACNNDNKANNINTDVSFIENNFNITGIKECYYVGRTVGNSRTIGPNDYEYFVFFRCSDSEIEQIKNNYTFTNINPSFGVSPTPTQKPMDYFTPEKILQASNYEWCYSEEFEYKVLENSKYMGKVYFDKINGYIYMWISTY